MKPAPVALFVFNRPRHAQKTIEYLRRNTMAPDTDLYVFSDGPKDARTALAVREVRNVLGGIDGFRSVSVIERSSNMGLAKSIIEGVTQLTEQFESVIVVEDDLCTSPRFLEFLNLGLDEYRFQDQVMQIAGHMFPMDLSRHEDALFLPFISSWGWGTWKRAWRYFDPLATGYASLLEDSTLRRRFDLDGHYGFFRLLRAQQENRTDSWAIRWYLSVFLRKGLALYPRRTLVRNLGFDGSGINCNISEIPQEDIDPEFAVRWLPRTIAVSDQVDVVFRHMPVPRPRLRSLLRRGKDLLVGH